jgi:hypothetical protein
VIVRAGSTTVIAPHVAAAGNVTLANSTLSVMRGTTRIANNLAAVRLSPGTYSVRTTARYRTYTITSTTSTTRQNVALLPSTLVPEVTCTVTSVVPEAAGPATYTATCSNPAYFDGTVPQAGEVITSDGGATWDFRVYRTGSSSLFVNVPLGSADPSGLLGHTWTQGYVTDSANPLFKMTDVAVTTSTRHYSVLQAKTLLQTLVVRVGTPSASPAAPTCATYANFQSVGGGMSPAQVGQILHSSGTQWGSIVFDAEGLHETRKYRSCDYSGIYIDFTDNAMVNKEYY